MTATHPGPRPSGVAPVDAWRGAGPRGMWWVAWRQHRTLIAVVVAVMALIAVALLVFRLRLAHALTAAGYPLNVDLGGSDPDYGAFDVWNPFDRTWFQLRAVMVAAPIVLGVFAGSPVFAREYEQRTGIFALTQSVSRRRWWATKAVVAGLPVVLGMLGLGLLMQWVAGSFGFTSGAVLYDGNFQVQGIIPAVFALVSVAIGVTAGIVTRSTLPGLVAALVVAGVVVIGLAYPLRTHLVPSTREVTPIAAAQVGPGYVPTGVGSDAPGSMVLAVGYLGADGQEIDFGATACTNMPDPLIPGDTRDPDAYAQQWNQALQDCMKGRGVVAQFTDYLPGSMLWPLRLVVTGICLAFAALVLAGGYLRLRAAPKSGN